MLPQSSIFVILTTGRISDINQLRYFVSSAKASCLHYAIAAFKMTKMLLLAQIVL
jgi:hypothetical protein